MLTAAFVMVAQWPSILEIPSGIHAWAQWDRYALALGFLENGFNFLSRKLLFTIISFLLIGFRLLLPPSQPLIFHCTNGLSH